MLNFSRYGDILILLLLWGNAKLLHTGLELERYSNGNFLHVAAQRLAESYLPASRNLAQLELTVSVLQFNDVLCVKEFRRSAAGEQLNDPEHLRPAPVLLQTTTFLLRKITHRSDFPFTWVYDFVFDR